VVGIEKTYPLPQGVLPVLRNLNLEVAAGESVAIIGASGVGKSTLLHILGALDRPTSGRVVIEGRELFSLSDRALALFRNRTIGFVFQFHHLLSEFSAVENVMMPGLISGQSLPRARERAMELLDSVGLREWAGHRPGELSGGEQQRVAVARALMNEPRIILADEPSGNLDREATDELFGLIERLRNESQVSMITVTHDPDVAGRADRILRLADGELTQVER
jgi:lipoprotein-releasing system ATP-binding protein